MRYSVYRPETGVYDYYETPKQTALNPDPQFLSGRLGMGSSALGLPSTDAGWKLPANARRVGSGKIAQGMIATRNGGFDLGDIDIPGGRLGLMVIATGVWWWLIGRKR